MDSVNKRESLHQCPNTSWHRPPQFTGEMNFKPKHKVSNEHFTIKEYEPDIINDKYPVS